MADYMPRNFAEFSNWLKNFETNLPGAMATKYGVSAPTLAQLALDQAWAEYWVPAKQGVADQGETVTSFVDNVLNGDLGGPTGTNPAVALPGGTPAPVAPGMRTRIREIVNGIKAQKSIYVTADGEFLGFEGPNDPPDPGVPVAKVFGAQTGNVFTVVVENRLESDRWEVLVQPVGGTGWTVVGSASGKSKDFTYSSPTSGSGPTQLQVRVQRYKNDVPYGPPSAIVLVTVNP